MLPAYQINFRKVSEAPRVTLGAFKVAIMGQRLTAKATSMPIAYKQSGRGSLGLQLYVDTSVTDTLGSDMVFPSFNYADLDQKAVTSFGKGGKANACFLNR